MNAQAYSTALGLLAVTALLATVVAIAGRTGMWARARPSATVALTVAWGVASVATIGSLVYSEVFHFVPCKLCWYQRIAMYPLAVILGIAWWRNDLRIRRYAVPVAVIGGAISVWHVLVQRLPSLSSSASCDPNAPCTSIWVEALGFLTIPTMALIGFVTIIALLLTASDED